VAIKSALTNNYWMPKTNTDAILADLCRHCPSFNRRNAATLRLALKYALTEHFNNNLVRLKTRPCLKLRRPFAQSALEVMSLLRGMRLSHTGLNTTGSRSGRSQGYHLIPFHPKWVTRPWSQPVCVV